MSNNVNNGNATTNVSGEQPTAAANVPRPVPLYVPPHRRAGLASEPVHAAPDQNSEASVSATACYHPGPRYASTPQHPVRGPGGHVPVASVSAAPYHGPFVQHQSAPQAPPPQSFAHPTFGVSVWGGPYHAPFTQRQSAPQVAPQQPLPPPTVDGNVSVASYYVPTTGRQPDPQLTLRQWSAREVFHAGVSGGHGYCVFSWPESGGAIQVRLPDPYPGAQTKKIDLHWVCGQPYCADRVHEVEHVGLHMWAAHGMQRY